MENYSQINPKIFKAYDIRGIYPEEINEETAYFIGQAFVVFLAVKNPKIVVGRDNRFSSEKIFKSLVKGIVSQGGNVFDIGLSTTPMLYFAAGHFKYQGGIQITASHNPGNYNGFKMVRENSIPISGQSGLKDIYKIAIKRDFFGQKNKKQGKILKQKILKDYLEFSLRKINFKKILPLKIVIDTSNAVSGILIPKLFKKSPIKFIHLFGELDGSFPNHPPDPSKKENLKVISQEIKKSKADLGIAFDGDGDRVVFLDQFGEQISGDLITALMSQIILREKSGQKIIYDIRSSNITKETIRESGGQPVISKIGHSLIKTKMRKEGVSFAGEFSGHYYHKDDYFSECPLFVLFKILEFISESGIDFSTTIKSFKKYFHSGEINFQVKNKEKILKKLEQKFKQAKFNRIDGLRADFDNWWFLVRASNTEPVIRLVVEAKTKALMNKQIKEIKELIGKNN